MPASSPKKTLAFIFKFWLPVLLCMGVIFYASSVSGSDIPLLFPFQDILFHFIIYMLLAVSFSRALKNTFLNLNPQITIIFAVIFGLFYGLADETHQLFVANRHFDGVDIFIDGFGSAMGSLIYPWLK
jgi:VanZ family protein